MVFTSNRRLKKTVACITAVLMVFMSIGSSGLSLQATTVSAATVLTGTTLSQDGDYFYDFRDGSIIPTDTSGTSDVSYETMQIHVGTQNAYQYNGTSHGVAFKAGNSIDIAVTGPTIITVGDCQYSNMTSLTLTSADGSYSETQETKSGCYHNDGSAMVFEYTGDTATTLTMTFDNTIYIPCIQVQSLHKVYDFRDGSIIPTDTTGTNDITYGNLQINVGTQNAYQYNGASHGVAFKAGNSIELSVSGATKITVGDCQYSNMTSMTLTSADGSYSETQETKSGCYHNDGSAMVFTYTGEEATTLTLSFTDTAYVPIIITDVITEEQPDDNGTSKDSVQMYNFADGSVVPATYDSANPLNGEITSDDGFLTITGAGDLYMHDTQHGLAVYNGNTFAIKVAGDATVTFNLCQYGADATATLKASSTKGTFTSDTSQLLQGTEEDGLSSVSFHYEGVATTLLFTVSAVDAVEMYLHGINVSNLPDETDTASLVGNGKIDVWDFGAEQLDETIYNNMLTVDIMNSWYSDDIAAGSTGATIGSFSTDEIFFNPAGRTNNRIRTSNTAITRYDTRDDITIEDTTLTGYLYSNNQSPVVYAGIKLYKNDILTVYTGSNGGSSTIYCESPSGEIQTAESQVSGAKLTFYASEYGMYKIYSTNEKLVIYRALREHTQPVTVSGNVDISAADGIEAKEYTIAFTNQETGEVTEVSVEDGQYSTTLYEGYTYKMSLLNANGYVISSTTDVAIATGAGNQDVSVVVEKVDLVTVTGELSGLTEEEIADLTLTFDNADYVYIPEFTITGTTYTAQFERNVTYTINAQGINDYYLSDITTIGAAEDDTINITFAAKPTYAVNVTFDQLPEEVKADAVVTFTNINEDGYSYSFGAADTMMLRDGQYSVQVTNIGAAAYSQKVTSDVKVDGASVDKTISFEELSDWDFSSLNGNPGIETINEVSYYSGLTLGGAVLENKTYLLVNQDGTVAIPVKAGDLVTLQYCYCAAFSIDGNVEVLSKSGSTSTIETTTYTATQDGVVTITGISGTTEAGAATSQTYFTSIRVNTPVAYSEYITVGTDKEYQTIQDALDAVALMNRPNDERVTIVIDPGNYEEMLTIQLANVSLVNAAGEDSSLELTNEGVDITDNAVRITSYYGHGYSYYSMGSDCKYDEDILNANQENGYLSTTNPGSGTTNGSYWNATVVVYADGFEADGIIFENSFNQYVSEKEAADTVVAWETGSKGERSTTAGDTSVQQKSYVERAAAMAIVGDQSVFNNCKFIGRQDTLYGGSDIKAVFQECNILGGTDYIFGGMTAVFYQCDLTMNTDSDTSSDVSYITAAQQSTGRGYLMYNCNITSTTPGVDTASTYRSKQGYFGRPWAANTSEVVYFMTTVETTDDPATPGQSLIASTGWNNSLGGTSTKMYEYGTTELSGEDNTTARADWASTLTTPYIDDGTTEISIAAFLGDWTTELQERGFVEELTADYSELEALVAQANALSATDYKDFSAVQTALAAITGDKVGIAYQAQVDALANALAQAVSSLEAVATATGEEDTTPTENGDGTAVEDGDGKSSEDADGQSNEDTDGQSSEDVDDQTDVESSEDSSQDSASDTTSSDTTSSDESSETVTTGDQGYDIIYVWMFLSSITGAAYALYFLKKGRLNKKA